MIAAAGNNETSRLLPQQERQHGIIGAEEEEDNEGMIPAALCDDRSPRHAYRSLLVPKNVQPHADQDGVVAPRREESSLAAAAADDDNDDTKFSVGPMNTVRQQFPEILPMCSLGMGLIMPSMAAERPAVTTTAVVAPSTFYGAGDTTSIDYCIGEIGGRSSSGGGGTTFSPLIRRESDWAVVHHHLVGEQEMVTEAVCLPCSSWPLTMTVGVAVLAQMLVGYNIGVMNAPEPVRGVPLKMFVPD
jgi:hypothetical protein